MPFLTENTNAERRLKNKQGATFFVRNAHVMYTVGLGQKKIMQAAENANKRLMLPLSYYRLKVFSTLHER